jgi:hypothetical protein
MDPKWADGNGIAPESAQTEAVDAPVTGLREVGQAGIEADVGASRKDHGAEVPVAAADVEDGAGEGDLDEDPRLERAHDGAVERHLAQVRAEDAFGVTGLGHREAPVTER